MEVPATRPEVTTTGIYGDDLDRIKKCILMSEMSWCGDLTSQTQVLVVGTAISRKYAVARTRGLPCVSVSWVVEGGCSMENVAEFDVCRSFATKEICTTGITHEDRVHVQTLCRMVHARYTSLLTRGCDFLVAAASVLKEEVPRNEKLRFAHLRRIPVVSFDEFCARCNSTEHTKNRSTMSASPSCHSAPLSDATVGHTPRAEPASGVYIGSFVRGSVAPCTPNIGFSVGLPDSLGALERDYSCEGVRSSAATDMVCSLTSAKPLPGYLAAGAPSLSTSQALSDVVAYCSPPYRWTSSMEELLLQSGVVRVKEVTPSTTHVIVLGEEVEECIYPRPGLQFVSRRWLEQCNIEQRRISCVSYRIPVVFSPTLTFSTLSMRAHTELVAALRRSGLPCEVQGALVLGSSSATSRSASVPPRSASNFSTGHSKLAPSVEIRNTTHLVVPRHSTVTSHKVMVLAQQQARLRRVPKCLLVGIDWVQRSIEQARWLDVDAFLLPIPAPEAFAASPLPAAVTSPAAENLCEPFTPSTTPPASQSRRGRYQLTPREDHDEEAAEQTPLQDFHGPSCSQHTTGEAAEEAEVGQVLPMELIARSESRTAVAETPAHLSASSRERDFTSKALGLPGPHRITQPSVTFENLLGELESHSAGDFGSGAATDGVLAVSSSTTTPLFPFGSSSWTPGSAVPPASAPSSMPSIPPQSGTSISVTAAATTPVAAANGGLVVGRQALRSRGMGRRDRYAAADSQIVFYRSGVELGPESPNDDSQTRPQRSETTELNSFEECNNPVVVQTTTHGSVVTLGPSNNRSSAFEFTLLITKDVMKQGFDWDAFASRFPQCRRTNRQETCTHFITWRPSKTEQFLCCLAAGRWILTPEYLTTSLASGYMVNEEAYEWRAETAVRLQCRHSVSSLVRGCRMQRMAETRPFLLWDATVCCSTPARAASFLLVLQCGGCTRLLSRKAEDVLRMMQRWGSNAEPPQAPGDSDVARVFLADDDVLSEQQLEEFVCLSKGQHILRLEYLVQCLCSTTPSIADFDLLSSVRSKKRPRVEMVVD